MIVDVKGFASLQAALERKFGKEEVATDDGGTLTSRMLICRPPPLMQILLKRYSFDAMAQASAKVGGLGERGGGVDAQVQWRVLLPDGAGHGAVC